MARSVPEARQLICALSSFLPAVRGADRLPSALLWAAAGRQGHPLLQGLVDMAVFEMIIIAVCELNAIPHTPSYTDNAHASH